MKTIIVERIYVNWECKRKVDCYFVVDSLETGLYLAEEIIKAEQKQYSNVIIEHPKKNLWIVTHKNEIIGDQMFGIQVREIESFTKDDIDLVISKTLKS